MSSPDRPGRTGERRLSPEERRRVARAALLRPVSLLVLAIGAVSSVLTLSWWVALLTLATYAALVFLAARDPLFWAHVLEGREYRIERPPAPAGENDAPPEQRVRRLPQGETRRKMEEALALNRRTMVVIEESDDVTRNILGNAGPKLRRIARRLLDVAERREQVAGTIRNLENRADTPQREDHDADLAGHENELHAADAEISRTVEKLSTLRSRVVRISAESGGAAREAAARLNTELDEMDLRLDALSYNTPPGPSGR